MKNLKKLLRAGLLTLIFSALTVPTAFAQVETTEVEPQVITTEDDGFDWGLLGLLGLLGLAGLAGRNRRDHTPEVKAYDSTTKR